MSLTEERRKKLEGAARRRQLDLTVVLENVHDPHNVSAVLRSCESVGISEIYILYTHENLNTEHLRLGKQSSASARKWVDVHYFNNAKLCVNHLKSKYNYLLGAYMNPSAKGLYELNLCKSTALVFGNERDGITEELVALLDGQFFIPQRGLIQSLNISVACAVTIYEALRQRSEKGLYKEKRSDQHDLLSTEYIRRHVEKYKGKEVIEHGDGP